MDSFNQSALDSQREARAIQDLQDAGIYPDPDNIEDCEDYENYDDYEPTDYEMMSSFGTKWHDGL